MHTLYHIHLYRLSNPFQGLFVLILCGCICVSASKSWGLPAVPDHSKQSTISIKLQPSAEIIGSEIYLRDIAVIQASRAISEQLGSIRIAKSPRPGMKRLLPKAKISYSIGSLKDLQNQIVLKGSDFIQIHRAYQTISDEYLRQVIQTYIDQKIINADFKLGTIKFHGKNRFPVGNLKASVTRHNTDKLLGNVKFVLSVKVDKNKPGHAYVSAWINRYEEVVYTKQALSRNTMIEEKDLYMRKINVSKSPTNICMRIEDAVGKRIKQNIHAESYLRASTLETPPTIYKGDRVKIIAGKGALLVSAKGLAKADGYLHEQIKVQNINSKRIVVGTVVDESTVTVNF